MGTVICPELDLGGCRLRLRDDDSFPRMPGTWFVGNFTGNKRNIQKVDMFQFREDNGAGGFWWFKVRTPELSKVQIFTYDKTVRCLDSEKKGPIPFKPDTGNHGDFQKTI